MKYEDVENLKSLQMSLPKMPYKKSDCWTVKEEEAKVEKKVEVDLEALKLELQQLRE